MPCHAMRGGRTELLLVDTEVHVAWAELNASGFSSPLTTSYSFLLWRGSILGRVVAWQVVP